HSAQCISTAFCGESRHSKGAGMQRRTRVATEPAKITIRMFAVGFGDCFLLTFHYDPPLTDQSILIDFGSASANRDLKGIANEIRKACNGKLYAVVATHRHGDHISGFSDRGGKDSPGAIIASCK